MCFAYTIDKGRENKFQYTDVWALAQSQLSSAGIALLGAGGKLDRAGPDMKSVKGVIAARIGPASGLTMIELMVALVVAAIVLSLAMPSFERVKRNSMLGAAAANLSASLSHARAEAIKARRIVRVCPTANGSSCSATGTWNAGWLMFVDTDSSGLPAGDELLQLGEALDSRIALTAPANFLNWIQFHPSGAATGSGGNSGSFSLCSGDYHEYSRLVAVSATGRVTTKRQANLCDS